MSRYRCTPKISLVNEVLVGLEWRGLIGQHGHDPTYVPRPQCSYDNELSTERNFAPIDSSELDDL